MIDEEYKKNEEYINSTILPKLHEIQREVLKKNQGSVLMSALAIDTAKDI